MKPMITKYIIFVSLLSFNVQICNGEAWKKISVDANGHSIEGICFIDEYSGWVSAGFAGVLRTKDGGLTWEKLSSNLENINIYSVCFYNKNNGWATGAKIIGYSLYPVILMTNDGGKSWISRFVSGEDRKKATLNSVYFNKECVWAVGRTELPSGKGLILMSTDNGNSWHEIILDEKMNLQQVLFTDSMNGFVAGGGGIAKTADGGKSWKSINPQQIKDYKILYDYKYDIVGNIIWLVGGRSDIFKSLKATHDWINVELPKELMPSWLFDVSFENENIGWVCGSYGTVLFTQNGGKEWRKEEIETKENLSKIAITKNRIIIVGEKGNIFILEK